MIVVTITFLLRINSRRPGTCDAGIAATSFCFSAFGFDFAVSDDGGLTTDNASNGTNSPAASTVLFMRGIVDLPFEGVIPRSAHSPARTRNLLYKIHSILCRPRSSVMYKETCMKPRIDFQKIPQDAIKGMYKLEHFIHHSGLEEPLVFLIFLCVLLF